MSLPASGAIFPIAAAMHFTLYSRSYCHLCQDMLDALMAMRDDSRPFTVEVIDIDVAPAEAGLLARYDELVPVLVGERGQAPLCHYFLDRQAVEVFLNKIFLK
jgi:Glutaredoxin-like domain (DUF836)